jgi:transcriptional regulator with XRE-family HTH domain
LADYFLPYTERRRVGANVRYLREQVHNWSRVELAERAKISVQTVRNIEEDHVFQPKMTTITGLANAFGISVSELGKPLVGAAQTPLGEGPSEAIPSQGPGPHFRLGPAGMIALAPPTDIDAQGNDIVRIRQLLPLVRRTVDDLIRDLNPNAFPELVRNVAEYRAAVAGDETQIAWGLVFGLGVMLQHSADAARRKIEDRLQPALEDAAQSELDTLLTLHGPLILATGEGRELADQADRMHLTREEQTNLRQDAEAVAGELRAAINIIEPPAAKVVVDAAEIIGQDPHPERGTAYGIATVRNVAVGLVGVAAVSTAFGVGPVETAMTWVGIEALKKSNTFSALTTTLGGHIDRAFRIGAIYRRFVIDNQEPLHRIATNSVHLRWMLPHINRISAGSSGEGTPPPSPDRAEHSDGLELSFDPDDRECLARGSTEQITVEGTKRFRVTSICLRTQASGMTFREVSAYITKIAKLMPSGEWQDSNAPDIQTTWAETGGMMTDISPTGVKHVRVLWIEDTDNKIDIWNGGFPAPLVDFLADIGKYRFTVAVIAREATSHTTIEIDWKGQWDTVQARPA